MNRLIILGIRIVVVLILFGIIYYLIRKNPSYIIDVNIKEYNNQENSNRIDTIYIYDTFYVENKYKIINQLLPSISYIESKNGKYLIGDGGKAYGHLQIHKICVDDVNKIYKTCYTHQQMMIRQLAEEVYFLYLQAGYDLYFSKHSSKPSEEQLVRMWNGGIYTGYQKESTLAYYQKYLNYKYEN